METDADEDWTHVVFPDDFAQDEVRRLAALENDALAIEHGSSLAREQEIADEMHATDHNEVSGLANSHDADFLAGAFSDGTPLFGLPITDSTCDANQPYEPSESVQTSAGNVAAAGIEGYSADNTFGLARSRLQPAGVQHFWETGFWNDFFDPNRDFLSSFEQTFKRPVDPTHDNYEVDSAEVLERKPKSIRVAATFMDHVKTTTVMSWRDQRDSEWQTAIYRWHAMLSTWDRKVQITEQVFCREGFSSQAQVLVDVFHNRAPSTIMKRCRSMSRMTNFFKDRGRVFPCDESQFYEFLCVERENGAPPSRLKGYVEAVTFCRHVLGVVEFEGLTLSRRCQGVAALDVDHKLQLAEPLSVKQLETLHRILFEDAEIWNQVFAGMLLFCVYARSRWSDAQHGDSILEDFDESGSCAYIEVATGAQDGKVATAQTFVFAFGCTLSRRS